MINLSEVISKFIDFCKYGIWELDLETLSMCKSFLIKFIRILLVTGTGLNNNMCQLHASALTLYSLLSVVPVAALAFGIAKGFGFEKLLENQLYEKFHGQEEVIQQVVKFSNTLLENTKGGMIAGIGIIVLLWTVIKVLSHIEDSMNIIWKVKSSRTIGRKMSNYLSIMLISPILVIISGSATVFITTRITEITVQIAILGTFSPIIAFMLKLIPYGLVWCLFTFIYISLPNIKVNFSSALFGGVIAGTMYNIAQWCYIIFQVFVSKYNAIYGSFAALPLFILWLQLSWLIVLIGVELSHAYQNMRYNNTIINFSSLTPFYLRIFSLLVAHLIVKVFLQTTPPIKASEISLKLKIPRKLVIILLEQLVNSKIFVFVMTDNKNNPACLPAGDINQITIERVITALDKTCKSDVSHSFGKKNISIFNNHEENYEKITTLLKSFNKMILQSSSNKLLKDI